MKQQMVLERIVTYSIALFLIVFIIVTATALYTSRPPSYVLASTCSIAPLLPCYQSSLSYSSTSPLNYTLLLTNNLGVGMRFASGAFSVNTTNINHTASSQHHGNCFPSYAGPGAQVICTVVLPDVGKPPAGLQTALKFAISYVTCSTSSTSSCSKDTYTSSGYSSQLIVPQKLRLYSLKFIVDPPAGGIALNGVTYFNGTSAYYLSGDYGIYAQPHAGSAFTSWSITGASSVASGTAQNTTLTLASDSTLTAEFG